MSLKINETLELDKELLLRIGSEGSAHTVSWEVMKNVGDKLEALILSVAKNNINGLGNISLDNFKLDFSGFYNGSPVPSWKFNSHPIASIFNDDVIRKSVIEDFTEIVRNVDTGNYQQIADKYVNPSAKNDIVKKIYEFTNSAGDIPVSILRRQSNNKFKKVYSVRRLNKSIYDQLIVRETTPHPIDNQPLESTAVAKVILKQNKTGKMSRKTSAIYDDKEATLSLKYDFVETGSKRYIFNFPLLFQLSQEGKGTIIENEQLDLYAAGSTMNEAKKSLFDQFDHTYCRLNELSNDQLSEYLLQVKQYYSFIIKSITKN